MSDINDNETFSKNMKPPLLIDTSSSSSRIILLDKENII